MIIALTGEKLAGKGTVAEYLRTQHQASVMRFSQPLTDILQRLHQPNTRAELVALASYLRQRFGDTVLVNAVVYDIQHSDSPVIVIDGMRFQAEYTACMRLPNFQLLNITAPVEIRFQRTRQRAEKADEQTMSYNEFTQREQDATEREISLVQAVANHTIVNDGTMEDLYESVNQWFATLRQ